MEKLKRRYLKVDERIFFGTKKGSIAERYYDGTRFSTSNDFNLYIDYGDVEVPKNVMLYLIYIDPSSKKNNEYLVQKEIIFPARISQGKNEIRVSVKVNKDGLDLYKIKFEVLPVVNCSLYISISDL